ncbi:MAG: carbon-nitrogen hydrolase family protein [Bacillota bacterium]|nr:carbon-nitrogen hydrolase family protein [Bacillota bacterium]
MVALACGVLQIDPGDYHTAHEYRLGVAARISDLARDGARLIVMPAHLAMAGAVAGRAMPPGTGRSRLASLAWAASVVTDREIRDWQDFYSAAAMSNKVYLCPGSYWVQTNGGYVHRADLHSPEGEIVGFALQTHSSEEEERAGLLCGTELPVFDVGGLRVGIELATDVWYPEVGRLHALQGVDVLVALTAVPSPYTVWQQTAGLWQVVQANQVFGIEASLSGRWLGARYHGRSRAFGPVECTEDGRGVLAEITAESRSDRFIVTLDRGMLRHARAVFPVFEHFNVGLYSERLSDAYLTDRAVKIVPADERKA